MFNRNSVVVCVTGVEDFGARFIWNKRTGKTTKCTYVPAQNVEGTFEECVLKVSAHTIEQYIEQFDEGKWHGKLALVLPHNVHLRACQVRRLYVKDEIHDADEILAEIVDSCSWEMSESHKSALSDYIVQFVQMMDETGLDIQTYDANELEYWTLTSEEKLEEGMEIQLQNGQSEDGTVICSNNAVNGIFVVKAVNTRKGVEYRIERPCNMDTNHGKTLNNIRMMWDAAQKLLPQVEEIDFDAVEETEGIG